MTTPRLFAFISLCVGIACGGTSDRLATQPAIPPRDTTTTPVATPPFVPPNRPAKVYNGAADIYSAYVGFYGGLLGSRYLLFEDSTFVLQFSSPRFGGFEYGGRFTRTFTGITFNFAASNRAGPWEATATFEPEALRVHYNGVMNMADFIDGAYLRER